MSKIDPKFINDLGRALGYAVAPASFKAEVIADNSGEWCSNALRFKTEEEAKDYAYDLASRWTLVRQWRVVESNDPVNYRMVKGHAEPIR